MQLRHGQTLQMLEAELARLRQEVQNFSGWSAGPSLDGLRNVYLTWVRNAEDTARRILRDVPSDQFATSRWQSVLSGQVPTERLWSVIEGDANAQLDWFAGVVDDIADASAADRGAPKTEEIHLFISHLAPFKAEAAAIGAQLSPLGVRAFVAHEDIDVSSEWQDEIERALQSMDAFVGLAHEGFSKSWWTQQEIGWALGRGVPVLIVRLGEDPRGFPGRWQAPSPRGRTPTDMSSTIAVWLADQPSFGPLVLSRLVADLRNARSFSDAKTAAMRFEQMGRLSPALLKALGDAYWANDQLNPAHVGAQVLQRIFANHRLDWPPPRNP